MELFNILIHFDAYLEAAVSSLHLWVYLILFLIIFAETGLVITPFLPGDSLLFAAGTLAARGSFNIIILIVLLLIAAIIGDSVNYWIGHTLGLRAFKHKDSYLFNPKYLERTHAFYEKYGPKTIFISRFVPIIRTFAPFVAGLGKMSYPRFILYNVTGAITWIILFLLGGFAFGNIPIIKENFSLVILIIIIVSILPAVYEIIKAKIYSSKSDTEENNSTL